MMSDSRIYHRRQDPQYLSLTSILPDFSQDFFPCDGDNCDNNEPESLWVDESFAPDFYFHISQPNDEDHCMHDDSFDSRSLIRPVPSQSNQQTTLSYDQFLQIHGNRYGGENMPFESEDQLKRKRLDPIEEDVDFECQHTKMKKSEWSTSSAFGLF